MKNNKESLFDNFRLTEQQIIKKNLKSKIYNLKLGRQKPCKTLKA